MLVTFPQSRTEVWTGPWISSVRSSSWVKIFILASVWMDSSFLMAKVVKSSSFLKIEAVSCLRSKAKLSGQEMSEHLLGARCSEVSKTHSSLTLVGSSH